MVVGPSESREGVADDALDDLHLIVGQRLEFAVPALLRKDAVVLPDEHDQGLGDTVGHFDGFHNPAHRLIMTRQVIDLARQILLDRTPDAGI